MSASAVTADRPPSGDGRWAAVEPLLEGMRGGDAPAAWRTFYELHGAMILRYARRRGLNAQDAEDVLQETMVTLLRLLPTFVYDPGRGRFVNFVLTVVHRKILALRRRASRRREVVSCESDEARHALGRACHGPARDGGADEWLRDVAAEAVRRVRHCPRTSARTFAVFEAYVLQHQPVGGVARTFGMKENAVYQIRNRVLRRVQAEVQAMTAPAARGGGSGRPAAGIRTCP